MNPNPVAAQATASALAGERTHETFSYPITGDGEADLISAILSLVRSKDRQAGAAARVCRYLAERFEREDRDQTPTQMSQGQAQSAGNISGLGMGGRMLHRLLGGD